uniref:Proton-gated ion channel subunit pbo-5 (projected from Caenorhabditis elegans ortholog pbo-5) n=1 Tax=Strongyloides venezuelensis TaxID=75913 RepID=A0A0K0F258_STRVS
MKQIYFLSLPIIIVLFSITIHARYTQEDYRDKVSILSDQIQNVHHTKEDEEKILHKVYVNGSSKRLTEHLMAIHNPHAPPDGRLEVHYEMELVHILGIDELKQTMTALVYVDEKWVDPSLSWDPTKFGGLNKTWLPMHAIWMPDIIIFNMVSASRLHHEDLLSKVRAPVVVYHNGTVECSHPAVYTVSCEINIRHFPLDDQRCALEIASWAYSWEKIRLLPHVEHSLEHYTPNEEWHLQNVNVKNSEYEHEGILVSQIEYEVSVRRKPLFYMVTLTFPSYVMCSISIVGLFARFSTTGEREERFTLGVTAILTMAVLSLVVSEKVPHSSTSVPLLVAYFLFNMVAVSFAAMTTGVVMKIHRKGRYGKQPPKWIMKLFLLKPNPDIPIHPNHYKEDLSKPKELIVEHDGINSSKTTLKHSESDDLNGLINDKLETEYYGEKEYFPKGSLSMEPESIYGIRLRKMKKMSSRFDDYLHCNQCEFCDHECNDQLTNAKIKHEFNGFVRIAERLDCVFMWLFLAAVTLPVVILFMMM